MTDDPRHRQIRKLVSSGLPPRVEDDLRVRCRMLLDAVQPSVPFAFGKSRRSQVTGPLGDPSSDIYQYGSELIALKRSRPAADMLSAVADPNPPTRRVVAG